jgi:hypothetical protein
MDQLIEIAPETSGRTERFAVISCGDEWRLVNERRQFGHFHRRASAWAMAVELAKEASASGHRVTLYLQGEDADYALNFIYSSPEG